MANAATAPLTGRNDSIHLTLLLLWHGLLTLLAAASVYLVATGVVALPDWARIIAMVALALAVVASAYAALLLLRRDRRGRNISLILNYLVFVATLLLWFQTFNFYLGINSLANTFGKGVPFLILIVLGYLVGSQADRFEDYPERARFFSRAGKYIAIIGALFFLYAVGILSGLQSLISRFDSVLPFVLTLMLVVLGVAMWLAWRPETAVALGAKSSDEEMLYGLLFLSPNLLGFLLFFAGPLLLSLYVSFTDWDAFGTRNWIGLANYKEIFSLTFANLQSPTQLAREVIDITRFDELTRLNLFGNHILVGAQDKLFWTALRNTLVFVLLSVPFSVFPALLLANVLNSKIRGMTVFRAIYFVPTIAAVVGVALIWRWLYNSTVGWINFAITSFVDFINGLAGAELLADPAIGWLSDTRVALLAVVIIAAWQWLGFNTVLFLAGLQGIPKSLYEAATVDGAGPVARFLRITVPLLGPTTFFVLTTTTIQAMQLFDQVFVLTTPPGGPGTSTTTIVLYLYQNGFREFRQGYASAIAWVLFLLIFGLTLFQFKRQRADSDAA